MKDVPIVALTGHEPRTAEIDARAAGCDRFLVKPFLVKPCDPDTFRAMLEATARRGVPSK